jgi:hypothetical protein
VVVCYTSIIRNAWYTIPLESMKVSMPEQRVENQRQSAESLVEVVAFLPVSQAPSEA